MPYRNNRAKAFIDPQKLLKNTKVISEIERYRWIESEKCGCDIDFDRAADNWLIYYALAWVKYHAPESQTYRFIPSIRRSLPFKKVKG